MNDSSRAGASPAERPADPRELLDRQDLTRDQKIGLLKDWQLDLMERMKATEENMTGNKDESRLAEQLRNVTGVLYILED